MGVYEITAYMTSDGMMYEDERTAIAHQEDIIGECLDALLMDDSRGNVTRTDRHSMLINSMGHPEFVRKVAALYHAATHGLEEG